MTEEKINGGCNWFKTHLEKTWWKYDIARCRRVTSRKNKVDAKRALVDTLPEKQQEQARALAKQIDEKNMQAIISYGAGAKAARWILTSRCSLMCKTKIQGIGDTLNELMMRLNETDPNDLVAQDSNIFRKIFGRVKKSIYEIQSKYQEVGSQVDKIAVQIGPWKEWLIKR